MSKIEAKYTNITGGFWDRYRKLNREKIIYAIKKVICKKERNSKQKWEL